MTPPARRGGGGGARPGEADRAQPLSLPAGDVAALAGGVVAHGDPGARVRGVSNDSRDLTRGMLFVALRGEHTDGHRFAADALRAGAAAALVAAAVPDVPPGGVVIRVSDTLAALGRLARGVRDRRALRVIGITGSVGKTSTKELTAAVLARRRRVARSPENWNTEIGIPLALLNLPEACDVAVLELAMRGPGQIRELVEICRPEIGVVTNVGESHMDFFESREQLAAAKGELIEGLPRDGTAVLNADDPLVRALGARAPARRLLFGLGAADVTARELRLRGLEGSTFVLRLAGAAAAAGGGPGGGGGAGAASACEVTLRIPGRHAVMNALAAAAVGAAMAIPAREIARGLETAAPLPMRLQALRVRGAVLLNDAYNSSPRSVLAAFDVLDAVPGSPRIAVLGDMRELGPLSAEAHRSVGREAARRVDQLIAFGPLAADLAAAARAAGTCRVAHTVDPDEAAALLRAALAPGAVALVKGSRALEMERIVRDVLAVPAGRP